MQDEERQLKKRFSELAERALSHGCYTNSEFLTPAEQEALRRMAMAAPYALEGGYPAAERKIAFFGSVDICGYEAQPPVCCLRIAPAAPKFAEALGHRDFLGALMGLGFRREVLGDIVVSENRGFLFCLDSVADYIAGQLQQVRRTQVTVARTDGMPPEASKPPEPKQLVVASERLDAVVAAVYALSRAESQKLFEQGKVALNSVLTADASKQISAGDLVSARGFGRFVYEGVDRETRRGRLRVNVRVY